MDYFFSVRGRDGEGYSNRLAGAKFLAIPANVRRPKKSHEVRVSDWTRALQDAACATATEKGNILIFVHGFNTEEWEMLERHRKIRAGLEVHGYKGAVVSFDWPSDGSVLGYSSDRRDARRAADRLMEHGISRLARMQTPECQFNMHLLAHSMGSFLVREAFDFADDEHAVAQRSWTLSQVALVAADISSKSLRLGSPKTSSLLRHCTRLTNYYSPHDDVLSISEVKRIGVSRRLGRVGMPDEHSDAAVDVYCGDYFKTNEAEFGDAPGIAHRWYFDAPRFYEDLFHTLMGKLDRTVIPTRVRTDRGNMALS